MRSAIKIIVAISFVTLAVLIILPIIFLYLKISLGPFGTYISTIGSVIVILLMLITIILTENATTKQIESWERWDLIQRKQSIKSLIKEFQLNGGFYIALKKKLEEKKDLSLFNNLILTSLEKSLYKPSIDNELINYNLLILYYTIKGHEGIIEMTKIPIISDETRLYLINIIIKEFEINKELFDDTRRMLEEYEQKLD
jgi:hypothetical protein